MPRCANDQPVHNLVVYGALINDTNCLPKRTGPQLNMPEVCSKVPHFSPYRFVNYLGDGSGEIVSLHTPWRLPHMFRKQFTMEMNPVQFPQLVRSINTSHYPVIMHQCKRVPVIMYYFYAVAIFTCLFMVAHTVPNISFFMEKIFLILFS